MQNLDRQTLPDMACSSCNSSPLLTGCPIKAKDAVNARGCRRRCMWGLCEFANVVAGATAPAGGPYLCARARAMQTNADSWKPGTAVSGNHRSEARRVGKEC